MLIFSTYVASKTLFGSKSNDVNNPRSTLNDILLKFLEAKFKFAGRCVVCLVVLGFQ